MSGPQLWEIRIDDSPDGGAIMVNGLEVPYDGGNIDVYVGNVLRYTVEFVEYPSGSRLDKTTHSLWDGTGPYYQIVEHNDPEVFS